MSPEHFLRAVAAVNVSELTREPGDLRIAANTLLTLDAFVGILHADLRARGLRPVGERDDAFRDELAAEHQNYRLVRDTASALKHGELTGKKPRLTDRADRLAVYSGKFDEAVFDSASFDTDDEIWIEMPSTRGPDQYDAQSALATAKSTLQFLETVLARFPRLA